MKSIVLKSLPDPRFPTDTAVEYRECIEQAIRIPFDRQNGASIDEMRKGIRVLDALDSANGAIELEDADYEFLKQKVERMPWARIDKRFLQFYDDVMQAT
jgi:hypothetical protein